MGSATSLAAPFLDSTIIAGLQKHVAQNLPPSTKKQKYSNAFTSDFLQVKISGIPLQCELQDNNLQACVIYLQKIQRHLFWTQICEFVIVCFKTDRLHIAYNGMSFFSLTNPADCISFSSQLSATQRNFNVSGAGPTISLLLRMASWPPSAPNANADILKVSRMRLKLAAGDPPSHSKSTSVSKHIADIPSGPSMMNAFVKRFSLFHLLASIICWVGDKDCSAPKPARIFAMCSSSKKTNNARGFGSMSPRRPEGFHSTFHTRSPSVGTVSSLTVMSGSLSASCMAWKAVAFAEQCTGALFSFKHISFGCNSCATRGRWWGGGGLGLGWWWGRGSKDPQAAAMASRGGCCLEPNELPLHSLYIDDFANLLWI